LRFKWIIQKYNARKNRIDPFKSIISFMDAANR